MSISTPLAAELIDPFLCREDRHDASDSSFCCASAHLSSADTLLRWCEEAMLLSGAHREAAQVAPNLDDRPFMHVLVGSTRHCLELALKLVLEQQGDLDAVKREHDLGKLAARVAADSWLWTHLHPGTIAAFNDRAPRSTEDRYARSFDGTPNLIDYCCVSLDDIDAVLDAVMQAALDGIAREARLHGC